MKKFIIIFLICTLICSVFLAIKILTITPTPTEKNLKQQDFYFKSGNCPECGTKLVKGIYGQYEPKFCWYCPNCE